MRAADLDLSHRGGWKLVLNIAVGRRMAHVNAKPEGLWERPLREFIHIGDIRADMTGR